MIQRYTYGDVTWIDCESPSKEEVRALMTEYNLEPLVAEQLISPSLRSKVEHHKDHLYAILHFPTLAGEGEEIEVDFIIGKEFIITTRYQSVDALHDFSKIFQVGSILDRESLADHGGFVFYYMVRELYRSLTDQLYMLMGILRDIETNIFREREREMVLEISHMNRKVLRFRSSIKHHGAILESLEQQAVGFFDKSFAPYLQALAGDHAKIASSLESMQEYLTELRRTNDSLLTTKQNEIIKTLTIMAFTTFPLTVIAGVFGMNTEHTPIVGADKDFWIIVAIMLTFVICIFTFFKRKRWL